jgi:hypothetical protein
MTVTDSTSPTDRTVAEEHPTADGPLPEFADWLAGVFVAVGGLLSLVAGSVLWFVVDRDAIAEGIEEGTITVGLVTEELTEAETIEVADAVVSWVGAGLIVTGVGMILFAAGYVVSRRRTRRRAAVDGSVGSYGAHAVLGAVATAVLSFIPLSPGVGGALAGYLERGESERTASAGALSGLLAMLPFLSVLVFVSGGLITGLRAVEQGGMATVAGATTLFALVVVAAIGAGLGALGGYAGGRFAESRAGDS